MTLSQLAHCLVLALTCSIPLGCDSERPVRYPNHPPPPGYGSAPPPGYAPTPGYAPQPNYAPQPGYPPAPTPPPTTWQAPTTPYPPPRPPAPTAQPLPPPRPRTNDPINALDMAFLRDRAQAILTELVAALPEAKRNRVSGIPLLFDDNLAEVNAFAACSKNRAAMAITAGILDIQAHLSQAAATDEVFGTQKLGEYIYMVASTRQEGKPPTRPGPTFYSPAQAEDPRKLVRQHQIFDEQAAFVLGHELAHHYLSHLPCTAQGLEVNAAELSHILASQVPVFNQPNEYAADVAGTVNLLDAAARSTGYRWTENGALLTMKFFAGMSGLSARDILFGFERSHPPPELRVPVIQTTARSLRAGLRPFF